MSGIAPNPLEASTGSAQSHANAVSASSGPSAREAVARPSNDLSDNTNSEHRVDQGPTWKAYDPQKVNNYLPGGPIANDRGASSSIAATDAPRSDVTPALAPATLDGDQDGTRNAQATIPSPPSTSDLPPAASTPPTASTPSLERARYVAALSSPQATNHAQQLIAQSWSDGYAMMEQGILQLPRLRSPNGPTTPRSGVPSLSELISEPDIPASCEAVIALAPEASQPSLRIVCADLLNRGAPPETAASCLKKYLVRLPVFPQES